MSRLFVAAGYHHPDHTQAVQGETVGIPQSLPTEDAADFVRFLS